MNNNDYLLNKLNNPNIQALKDVNNNQFDMSQTNVADKNLLNPNQFNIPKIDNKDRYSIKVAVTKELNNIMANNGIEADYNFLHTTLTKILSQYSISENMKNDILTEIIYDIKGYGILQPFLDDPDITEIICCTYDNIWVEKFGKMIKTNVQFANEKELRNLIDKIVQPLGRRIDDDHPMENARLKDQSRVNIVINPISADGATLDIRKFSRTVFTINDYVEKKSMTKNMGEFMKWCVTGRKNIIVSGGTGSGKTTLLNCLSRFVPENEAIITIEDLLELQLVQPCVRRLEARGKNAEGKGEITIRDCVVNALRMRPDRIIVGECRSHEVIDMLQAMNTGHDGSLTTVHANNPKDMVDRLYVMYLMGGMDVPEKAIKSQISSAIDIIIQTKRLEDGSRKITQISEVLGLGKKGVEINNNNVKKMGLNEKFYIKNVNNSEVYIQDIYRYDSIKQKFVSTGWVPTFYEDFIARKYPLTVDMFKEGDA